MKLSICSQEGYTLVELLVGVSITAILVIASTNLFFSISKSAAKDEAVKYVKQNGDAITSQIENDLRWSEAIVTNADSKVCTTDMKAIKIRQTNKTVIEWSSQAGEIYFNGAPATDESVTANNTFNVNCYHDPVTNNTYIDVAFTLQTDQGTPGEANFNTQNFSTSVSIRNAVTLE